MIQSPACDEFVKGWERKELRAYKDIAGNWTIGYGHLLTTAELAVYKEHLTDDECEGLYLIDALVRSDGVTELIGDAPTTQCQFDALFCFAWNVGLDIDTDEIPEGLGDSRLLKLHLAGRYQEAADEFLKWTKAWDPKTEKRVVVPGLVKRRTAERAMYLTGDYGGRP